MRETASNDTEECLSQDQLQNSEASENKQLVANCTVVSVGPSGNPAVISEGKRGPRRTMRNSSSHQNDTSTAPVEDGENGKLQTGQQEREDENEKPASKPAAAVKPKQKKKRDVLDFTWICTECNEAECDADPNAELLLCEGGCHRPFHYPCANLSSVPAPDEDFVCEDCQKGRHKCVLCDQYGNDNVEVFCCDNDGCGLFFHESCLSMQNVEITFTEDDAATTSDEQDVDGELANYGKPHFICPAHSCWTCTEDIIPVEEAEESEKPTKKKKGKGRKKKNKVSCSFATKRDPNLYRCLHCPIAYHLTCIPPMARFHELAMLCHEHAGTYKLPDLDLETSMQAVVEAKVEEKIAKGKKTVARNSKNRAKEGKVNHFFPGVLGDDFVSDEDRLLLFLQGNDPQHEYLVDGLPFCLPCDVKNEVHSKPPSYYHVHSNQYEKAHRPKRKPPSDGKCECKAKGLSACDDSCINRMIFIECVGDVSKAKGEKSPYVNCDIGPSCTNRGLGLRQFAKCKPMREQGKGWGLVPLNALKKGDLVIEYVGEVIDEKEKENRLIEWARDHPNDPNFYVMALETGWYLDARNKANLSRFINHSCAPNCRLLPMNVNGYIRVGIYTLRDIAPGEFLSYDYQFDTKHGDKFRCRCGAANCRGTMKGGRGEDSAVEKTRKEEWQDAKAAYDRDVKYLEDAAENEQKMSSQVDYLVPGAENPTETVAMGPNEKKHRSTVMNDRIFLWRNVVQGDISDRPPSMRRKRKRQNANTKLSTVDVFSLLSQSSAGGDN